MRRPHAAPPQTWALSRRPIVRVLAREEAQCQLLFKRAVSVRAMCLTFKFRHICGALLGLPLLGMSLLGSRAAYHAGHNSGGTQVNLAGGLRKEGCPRGTLSTDPEIGWGC
jgi:hypothetical protein